MDIFLVVIWIDVMLGLLILPVRAAAMGRNFTSSLFTGIGILFLLTGLLISRLAETPPHGLWLIMIPSLVFSLTGLVWGYWDIRKLR